VKAQLGLPDMRLPIQYAMAHPKRLPTPAERLDLSAIGSLTFTAVDTEKYPCLGLAYAAGRQGGTCPTVLNAANEIAVARFLNHELPYMAIATLIESALEAHAVAAAPSLDEVIEADRWARQFAQTWQPRSL
jgi:1-deoxy-D-xylulose-5-phosphate reductoisomerase